MAAKRDFLSFVFAIFAVVSFCRGETVKGAVNLNSGIFDKVSDLLVNLEIQSKVALAVLRQR